MLQHLINKRCFGKTFCCFLLFFLCNCDLKSLAVICVVCIFLDEKLFELQVKVKLFFCSQFLHLSAAPNVQWHLWYECVRLFASFELSVETNGIVYKRQSIRCLLDFYRYICSLFQSFFVLFFRTFRLNPSPWCGTNYATILTAKRGRLKCR